VKILVTGGAVFIGSHFVRRLLSEPSLKNVIVLDNLTYAGRIENLVEFNSDPRFRFVKGDILDVKIVDVREDWEIEIAKLPGSEVINQKLAYEILNKMDKNTEVVFYCHHGLRSLEAASYFKGHGLPNVKSLKGGIELYTMEVDPSIPRY
jgi:rhodanese-related sulfurtransferase